MIYTGNRIALYQADDGSTQINVQFEQETVWLTQTQMAELFERERTVIGRHISNVISENELNENVVCANFTHPTQHVAIKGKSQSKDVKYYNLYLQFVTD